MDDKKDMKIKAVICGIITGILIVGIVLLSKAGVFTYLRTPELVEFTSYSTNNTEDIRKIWVNPQQVLYVYCRGTSGNERTVICMNGSNGDTRNYIEVEESLSTVVKSLKIK